MIAATRESLGHLRASRSGRPRIGGVGVLVDLELDDLHLPVGEDVGLAGRRHADRAGDA